MTDAARFALLAELFAGAGSAAYVAGRALTCRQIIGPAPLPAPVETLRRAVLLGAGLTFAGSLLGLVVAIALGAAAAILGA